MRWADPIGRRGLLLAAFATAAACKPAGNRLPPTDATRSPRSAPSDRGGGEAPSASSVHAYVAKACADLCEQASPEPCRCDVVGDRGDWLILRTGRARPPQMAWSWFVLYLTRPGYRLVPAHDQPPQDSGPDLASGYELCRERTDTSTPPVATGVMNMDAFEIYEEHVEIVDQVPLLRFECKQTSPTGVEHFAYECEEYGCWRLAATDPGKKPVTQADRDEQEQRRIERTLDLEEEYPGCEEDDDACKEAARKFEEEIR